MKSLLIYLILGCLLIFVINQSPRNHSSKPQHRRLKLKTEYHFSGEKHEPIPFDPLIAEIERHREDKHWEREYFHDSFKDDHAPGMETQPEWEDFMNAEDYLNDEQKFNITGRLVFLFPQIDANHDGHLSVEELAEWNLKSALNEVIHRTEREMEVHDKNHDGFVSFKEYEPPSWAAHSDNDSASTRKGWWSVEHFNASDIDGDGLLNKTEFMDFLHPSDSKNPKLVNWLCDEEIRERDSNHDGKLDFHEFFAGLFDLIRMYEEHSSNVTYDNEHGKELAAKRLFGQIDKDGDGYLSTEEISSIIDKLHPGENFYARHQAEYAMTSADKNKDGRLDLHEMIENPYVFYSSIFSDEDEDDYGYHDEFR